MPRYIVVPRNKARLLKTIARPVVLSIFLIFCIQNQTRSQSQTSSPENVKLFQQSVANKEYKKAAQYGLEIATQYHNAHDLNKAIEYINLSLTNAKKSADQPLIYSILQHAAFYNLDAKKYSKALEHFQDALTLARKLGEAALTREQLMNISVTYGYLERFKKAIEYSDEVLSLAIVNKDVLLQEKCYQLLAVYHDKQGNVKKSQEYQTQYNLLVTAREHDAIQAQQINQLEEHVKTAGIENQATQAKLSEQAQKLNQTNSSLRNAERSLRTTTDYLLATADSLKEMEAISRQRQMEIDLLQKDRELAEVKINEQEARIENEKLVRNSALGGSLLVAMLISVMIISYRKKAKDSKKIAKQNKNIKSSINYAKRIQEAMLPKTEQYPPIFQNSFILFKPRDTVSGDFYWMSEVRKNSQQNGDVAFASVDCTGHGVPGAFMSMIGINALNGLVNRGFNESHLLLDALDKEIRTALQQDVSGNSDGMDVSLCIYRQKENLVEFSGAKSPLVYIQNNELFRIKGDSHAIGGRARTTLGFSFKKHEIKIDKPTVLYLFSDGYKDQFSADGKGKFLSKKLNKLLLDIHNLPMEDQLKTLEATIQAWKGDREQTDDILVMGLKLG